MRATIATRGVCMALVKCRDCGNDVSDAAPACPKCGCPISARPQPNARFAEVQDTSFFGAEKEFCTSCQEAVFSERQTPGSVLLLIVLTCFFFLPGVLYLAWMLASRYDACPNCGGRSLVPVNSPAARRALGSG